MSSRHQPGDLLFISRGVEFCFESVVERGGIFGAIARFGEVYHAALEVGEWTMLKCGLFDGLLDEEVFGLACVHCGDRTS